VESDLRGTLHNFGLKVGVVSGFRYDARARLPQGLKRAKAKNAQHYYLYSRPQIAVISKFSITRNREKLSTLNLRAGVFTRPRHILIIPRCAGKGRLTTRKPDRAEVKICIAPIEKARQLCGLPTPLKVPMCLPLFRLPIRGRCSLLLMGVGLGEDSCPKVFGRSPL